MTWPEAAFYSVCVVCGTWVFGHWIRELFR